MNIPQPQYLCEQIQDYFIQNKKHEKFNSLERNIIELLMTSLERSEKYIFSDDFNLYLEGLENIKDFELDKERFFKKYKIKDVNIAIEYIEKNTDVLSENLVSKEVLNILQILDRSHPLFKKLMEMLNYQISKNREAKLLLYYRKDQSNEKWGIPVQTILVFNDGTRQNIDIFPRLAFELNNSMQSTDQRNLFLDLLMDYLTYSLILQELLVIKKLSSYIFHLL